MFDTGVMGFTNPAWSWSELEAALSDRRSAPRRDGRAAGSPAWNAGGDAPAWSHRRQPFISPRSPSSGSSGAPVVPYAELHCHSNLSFLDGAAHPEELVVTADRLGLEALALTDRNGLYGVVRFAEAARSVGLATVFGAEIGLAGRVSGDDAVTVGFQRAEPPGVVVLAEGTSGYSALSRAISLAQLAGSKGEPRFDLGGLADETAGRVWVLTGGADGLVPAALVQHGPAAARRELEALVAAFGRDRVLVELWDHGEPFDTARNDALVEVAAAVDVECVAANDVRYAVPSQRRLATALTALRHRGSLDAADPWLAAGPAAHLRSGAEQQRRLSRYPGVIERTVEIARAAAFDLALVAPSLPPFPCPDGYRSEIAYLRDLVKAGGRRRYGERPRPTSAGGSDGDVVEDLSLRSRAWRTIDHELSVIEQLGFAGYFLVVWDLVEFCRSRDIYCQGRGSAANSAVCYALGVTAADAVSLGLLFERFLSPERDGPPDIDIDIESGRREEVIQYVYERYGRHHTAQVANVITYRARSAVRDMARALGYRAGEQDRWAAQVSRWDPLERLESSEHDIPGQVLELAGEVVDAPRHLGIHSGGMVICDRPVIEVCPVEWARRRDRSVLQWDKDDCAAVGLVKFDLLGLGMLSGLHGAVDLIRDHRGYEIDLATLPQQDEVYAMLCRADTVGVFQIESRAQMATLPRLKPRRFYDLVVEVALIRPGPIQGGSVHPYIRRRNGEEPVTFLHPLLENSLGKTLGVPLFQEQLMQMAIDVAGFSPAESDQLRQAMGSKRSTARMEHLRQRLFDGMAQRGIVGEVADEIFHKMRAFANYGFPESHAVSFAYLVYSSAWIKYHEPAAFCAALLNAQPMGFWSPHTLVRDARRHGVVVRTPDLNASAARATLEPIQPGAGSPPAIGATADPHQPAVRLGLGSVRGISDDLAQAIVAARQHHGPYVGTEDLVRRVPTLNLAQLEAFATAGVFGECFGLGRREALWNVGAAVQSRPGRIPGIVLGAEAPCLPGMEPVDEAAADLWAIGMSPDGHPTSFIRDRLDRRGVVTAEALTGVPHGTRVQVAGVVTHRQRPMTARGTTFINLEDETGLINVVVSVGCWARYRRPAASASALLVRGRLESTGSGDGPAVINVIAEYLEVLAVPASTSSRDFR